MVVLTGANYQASIGIESAFNSGTGTAYGNLGLGMSVSAFSLKQDIDMIYGLGNRNPAGFFSKGHTVDLSTEFYLCGDNKNWIQFVLPASGYLSAFAQIGGGGTVYTVSGVVYKSAKINVKQNDLVTVSMDGVGAGISTASGSVSATIPATVYTWKDVKVSGISQVITDLSLSIDNSVESYFGLGSETITAYAPLKFVGSLDMTILDPSSLIAFGDTSTTFTITIGNYTVTATGVLDTGSFDNIKGVETVTDKVSYKLTSVSIV